MPGEAVAGGGAGGGAGAVPTPATRPYFEKDKRDLAQQILAANRVVEKRLSVRDTEKLVAQTAADSAGTPGTPPGGRPRRTVDADLARLQEQLADHLNAPVELHANARGKGRLVIHFDSVEQFEGLRAALGLDSDALGD